MLIIATYALVDHNLPAATSTSPLPNHYMKLCKELLYQPGSKTPHPPPSKAPVTTTTVRPPKVSPAFVNQCRQALSKASLTGSLDQRRRALQGLLTFSLLGLAFFTLIAAAIGWLMSSRMLRPVRALTETARRASDANLGERLALEGPDDELKELATTFDAMLDRLDSAFASQRRFVANASHELRTPLTTMRTAIDVTLTSPDRTMVQLEEMAQRVRRAVDKADQIVEALLTLAVSHQGLKRRDVLDLATVVEDALDSSAASITSKDLRVEPSLQSAPLRGDGVLLERLVINLVDNAIRHNVYSGWISAATGRSESGAFVMVSSSGPMIADETIPRLLEPFGRAEERLDPAGGVGLGLALVQSIAAMHSGTVEIHGNAEGGLRVTVRFGPSSLIGAE